jgi:formylglycine-generating enzyme required for sulfatase activity
MGSPKSEICRSHNEDQHTVTLTHSFEIQRLEVSEGEFRALTGIPHPSGLTLLPQYPANPRSWYEAAAYLRDPPIISPRDASHATV